MLYWPEIESVCYVFVHPANFESVQTNKTKQNDNGCVERIKPGHTFANFAGTLALSKTRAKTNQEAEEKTIIMRER